MNILLLINYKSNQVSNNKIDLSYINYTLCCRINHCNLTVT